MYEQLTTHRPWGPLGPTVMFTAEVPPEHREEIAALCGSWKSATFGVGSLYITTLTGGANNRNYVVRGPNAKFALRLANQQSERLAVDRGSAYTAQKDAAEADLAPQILASRLPEGHVLAAFLEGQVLDEKTLQEPEILRAVARLLRELHSTPTTCRAFSPFDDIRSWAAVARQDGAPIPDDFGDLLGIADRIEERVSKLGLPSVFCHNDAGPKNFILGPDGKVRLVDWEYAGRGWAYFELGLVCCTAGLDDEQEHILLAAYDADFDEAQRARVKLGYFVAALREAAWAIIATSKREGSPPPLESWKYEQYMHYNLEIARGAAGSASFVALLDCAGRPGCRQEW